MILLMFELKRLIRAKLVIAILALIALIGFAGIFLTRYYGGTGISAATLLVGVYNGYCQFGFIVFGSLTAFLISSDIKHGITEFLSFVGLHREKELSAKIYALLFTIIPAIAIVLLAIYLALGVKDIQLLAYTEALLILSLITTVLFGALVGLLSVSPIYAVVTVFLSTIVFSILNALLGGLVLQGDANSVSTFFMNYLVDDVPQFAPARMFVDVIESYGFLLSAGLSITWIFILTILLFVVYKKLNLAR